MGRDGHKGVGERFYKNTLLGGVGILVILIIEMVLWFVCIQKLKKLYIIRAVYCESIILNKAL